jgi:flagellar biosynthesis/type III secretory pathway protein FliH
MATILRAAEAQSAPQVASFNLDDVAAEAADCLAQARIDAAEIVATAEAQAADIRRQAAEAGCKAAMQEFEKMVAAQVAPAIEALGQTVAELQREKQAWISHWESGAVHLAAAIAAKIIRRELRQQPEITLALVREALDLAAGSPNVRLHLNPEDYKSLGVEIRTLIDAMSALGDAEVTPDATVGQGGCRVETRFGTIDQQIETQLQRIEEELAA